MHKRVIIMAFNKHHMKIDIQYGFLEEAACCPLHQVKPLSSVEPRDTTGISCSLATNLGIKLQTAAETNPQLASLIERSAKST